MLLDLHVILRNPIHIHKTEWPSTFKFTLTILHQPIELFKILLVSKVKGEGDCWVDFAYWYFSCLSAVVSFSIVIFDSYFYASVCFYWNFLFILFVFFFLAKFWQLYCHSSFSFLFFRGFLVKCPNLFHGKHIVLIELTELIFTLHSPFSYEMVFMLDRLLDNVRV